MVLVDSKISTIIGETEQQELYILVRDIDKGWQISELKVGDEIIDEIKIGV